MPRSYEEYMEMARRAHEAGRPDHARRLVALAQEARAAAEAAPEPEPELMEVERREPIPPFEQQRVIRDRIEAEIENQILQGLEKRANDLTTPEMRERERARLEATIRPTVERAYGQVYTPGVGLTTPPAQGGFIPFFRPSRIAEQPDGTRLYRDPATGELREPTPGEELFESFAQQQILSEQEVQQAALMGEAPEEGFGILQRVEPGFGVYEAPLSAALRGIGGGLLALGDEAYAAIDFTVTPEAADEAERLRKESWEVLLPGNEVEGESYWERYGRSRDLNNQAEDVLLQGAVDPSEAGYKMAQLRRRLGIPDTMAHPTIRYVQVPIPFGQARVQAPTEAFEADPRRERERSEAPELTRRVGQNIAAGRTISNAVLEMPMTSGFYDAVWGDPEAGALLTMGGEAILPIGPGTAYRGVRSASGATSALRRSLENLKLEEAGHRIMEMGRFTRAAPPAPDAVSTARALPVDDPALSPSTQRLLDLGLLRRSRAPSPTTVPEPRVSLRGSDGKVGAPAIGLDTTVPLDEYIVRRLSRRLALATGAARRAGTGAAAPTLPTGAARAVPSRPSTTARAATTTGAARRAGTEPVQRLDTAYNRALATAAEAAATTGDYMRVVYRAARGDVVNPIVAKKVAERVLRSAGLEEDLISRAVKAIRPASATFNDVWTDISRSLVRKVEGGGEVFALDVPTMQRIERGLKLGIPDDYVMITDDIAVPRSIAGDLRDRASRFAQSQILRDQSSKWMYLDRVINTYAGKVDSKLINRLRRLRDGARDKRNIRISEGIETLTDGLSGEIAKRDKLVIAALEDIRAAAVALAKADPEINATQAANIGRRLVEGYRYRPMNEIQQTLRSALREGIPVARSFDELDLSKRELVVERLKEHFITQQAGNLARNTMDVGAMQLYLDRSIKGFSNLLDFRALNTPFSRQLMALFGRKLDDTTKFSVDMANLLRRAGRGRAREIARLVEEQARTVNAHITATLQGVKDARRASQRSLDEARRAARKARYPEAARAAERRVAREEAEAAELATRLDQTVADVLAVQRRLDESGTAVAAIEMLLDRMARASRLPPEQIWEQVFSTMFNPKLNRQILKQALEEAGVGEVFVRYPTVETINTVARVAQDIPQVRWAGRTTPFTNDAVKHLLAAMMDGPIREAAARGIITREVQRKINLAPYFREAMEKNKGLADAVFDPEIGAKIEENSRVLGMTFPVDRPLGASRITPGVDTEFERVIAQGGGEFLELLNYVQPKYRASLGGLALQAGQYLLQQGQMGIRQAAKYGYAVPNVPFLIYKRLEMPFVAATQVGVSDAIKGFQKSSLAQYVRNQILRRNTTGGGITTPEGVYYSPSDLARLAEQEGIGYTAVEAERVGLAMTDMIQDINQRIPAGARGLTDIANPVTKTFWIRTAEAMERSFRQGVFEARLAAGNTVREAAEAARRSVFDYDEVPQGLRAGILPHIYQGAATNFKLTSEMALLALKNPSALGKYMRGLETMQEIQDPYGLEGDRSLLNLRLPKSVTMGDDYYLAVPGAGIAARTMIAARHGDNLVNSMKAARAALIANAPGKAISEVGVVAGVPFVYTLVDSAIGPVLKAFDAFEGADPYPTAGSQRAVSDEKIFWAAMLYAIDRDPTMTEGDWADFQQFYDPQKVEPPPEREHPQIPGAWAERPEGMPYVFAGRTAPTEQNPEGIPIYRAYEMGENGKFNLGVVRGLDPTDIRRFFPTYIAGTVGDVAYGDPQGAGRIERVNAEQFVDETGVQEAMNLFFNPAGIDYSKPEEVRAAQARELLRARTPLQPTP